MHTMEHYSAKKKKGILPFATIQVDLISIILSEIWERKANTALYYLYVECLKN